MEISKETRTQHVACLEGIMGLIWDPISQVVVLLASEEEVAQV